MKNEMDIVELSQPSANNIHKVWVYKGAPVVPVRMTKDKKIVIHKEASIGKSCNTSDLEIKKAMFDDLIKNYHFCSGDANKPKIASLEKILEELEADETRKIILVSEEAEILELAMGMVADKQIEKQVYFDIQHTAEGNQKKSTNKEIKIIWFRSLEAFIKYKKKNG